MVFARRDLTQAMLILQKVKDTWGPENQSFVINQTEPQDPLTEWSELDLGDVFD
jgi:hypothetical protein